MGASDEGRSGGGDVESVDVLYKFLAVGETDCGKTTFLRRYVHNVFSPGALSTIGVDFALKTLRREGGETTVLQLWDIGGHERHKQMMRVYFHGAVGALVFCDSQSIFTLEMTKSWKSELDLKVCLPDGSPIPCVLVINKIDLGPCEWSEEKVEEWAKEQGFVAVHYTSALTGEGVHDAVRGLVDAVERIDCSRVAGDEGGTSIQLNETRKRRDGGGMCRC